jgi:DNA polymerase III epsilon subunit-like protein
MLQKISTDSLPDTFVVFDLETTGLDASQHGKSWGQKVMGSHLVS